MTAAVLDRREARLGGELGDVAHLRHSIGGWLRGWDLPTLVEDVELVASELITNAILHAGGEVDVTLERRSPGVRVLVRDGRPDVVPARRSPAPLDHLGDDHLDQVARSVLEGTTTGRGLLLVDAFADAWGVDLGSDAKVVWADLGTGQHADSVEQTAPAAPEPRGVEVRLRAVPVRLILLSAANMDDLVRELQTTDFAAAEATRLAALGERLVQETLDQRQPLRLAARAALQQRARRVDVELQVPPDQVDVLRRFVSLTDQVDELCTTGLLLTQPPTEELTAFRRWFVDELDRQVRGDPARTCPFPD